MRRFLAALLAVCLLCTLAFAASGFADGRYSGQAQGRNGPIEAEVTVQSGKITDVDVAAYAETPAKLQQAMQIVGRIVGCESYTAVEKVDAVSGATVSSEGIKNAVLDALKAFKPQWGHAAGESCPSANYTDVPPVEHWAHEAIDWAVATGTASGVSATEFAPFRVCTRAQIVTLLWRVAGAPVEYGALHIPFEDVGRMQYYTQAVHWAATNGVVAGVDAAHFAPAKPCTRAQVVTILWSMAGRPEPAGETLSFLDVPEGAYYARAVRWAVSNGVVAGVSPTSFAPHKSCTRAEIVMMLYRAQDLLVATEIAS